MSRLDELLTVYSASHQNPVNQAIHYFCVPAILTSFLMLLWMIPFPVDAPRWVNWASLVSVATLPYYLRLSWKLALVMALEASAAIALCFVLADAGVPMGYGALGVFAFAWVLQFIGHGIEGKKPSLVEDLQYLLVGPLWVAIKLFGKVGINLK